MLMRIAATFVLVVFAATANAQDLASGAMIQSAISGNTVRGAMDASGGYEEFYDSDGTIKGADYSGQWSVRGDRMCFVYDGNPASCWAARLDGTSIIWVGSTGDEGTGQILPGNPRGY